MYHACYCMSRSKLSGKQTDADLASGAWAESARGAGSECHHRRLECLFARVRSRCLAAFACASAQRLSRPHTSSQFIECTEVGASRIRCERSASCLCFDLALHCRSMSATLSESPATTNSRTSHHSNPNMHQQQLQQQVRSLQTNFQTYTTLPTTATLNAILPLLQQQLNQLTSSLPRLTPSLLLPVVPTLLDLLDALAELPLVPTVQDAVLSVLRVLVWWAGRAERWADGMEDKTSTVYDEAAPRVREGYVRLGGAAEQWAAAVTLSTASTPAFLTLLPPLLTALTLSLPYLPHATHDSSVELLSSALTLPTTCASLLASEHLVELVCSLPAALASFPSSRLLAVTEAVLSLWRRGGVVGVRQYGEYRAMMVYTAGVSALIKTDVAAVTQLQQLCAVTVESAAHNPSQSLSGVFAVLGMLHTLDPKAAVYKHYRNEKKEQVDGGNNVSHTTPVASPPAASTSSFTPSAAKATVSKAAPTSIHLANILALQATYQSATDRLLSTSAQPSSSSASAAVSTQMTPPSFAASLSGIVSAACVNGVEWSQWTSELFDHVTGAFLTLIDTRWCATNTASFSLSSPPSSSSRNAAMLDWIRSPFFALLPHYSRAFSVLFLRAPAEGQCAALSRVRARVRDVHQRWRQYNRSSADAADTKQPPTAMEEDSAEDEAGESADEATSNDDMSSDQINNSLPPPPPPQPTTSQQQPFDRDTLNELQNTLFLSVCMALATVCRNPPLLTTWPDSAVCDIVDTMSWLEFVRVNFTGYRDVVVAVVNEGVRRSRKGVVRAPDGSAKQSIGWWSWLVEWRRWKQQQQQQPRSSADGEQKVSETLQSPNELIHTLIHFYLLPSLAIHTSSSLALASSQPSDTSLFPHTTLTLLLSINESDMVALSRHYFLLGLLSEWQDNCAASDALSTLLPYSASFLHCRVRGVLKRAHGLFVRSLALIVRHHTLQSTDAPIDGYALFLSVMLPYTRLVLSQYPVQLGLPTLMDSLVLLFHLLPSDNPLLLDLSSSVVDRIRQLTDRTRASSSLSSVLRGDAQLHVPTPLRHLLILHFQLVQLLSLPSFRAALEVTGRLFPTAPAAGTGAASACGDDVHTGMLVVLRDVIVRNFDLYRRDEAVRWWMAVKKRTGIVLAVPGPPPPLPVAAPSITTVKPNT